MLVRASSIFFYFVLLGALLGTTNTLFASSEDGEKGYDPVPTIMHHISDANEFEIVHGVAIPLPVILYAKDQGWTLGLSSMFQHGQTAVDGYVLHHGRVNRIVGDFPKGSVPLDPVSHSGEEHSGEEQESHKEHHGGDEQGQAAPTDEAPVAGVYYQGKFFALEKASAADGGLLGRGITSYFDFSITKNVFAMLLAVLILFIVFGIVSSSYKQRDGKAPSGLQGVMEPLFVFIRDEVARPMIGEKHYERFLPFVMSLFFFILVCNLLGLIPIFPGSANVTGNLAVTMALAILVFFVTNLSGKKDYWQHTLWMPGVPTFVKPVLSVVEILGLFIKPFSLMIRLFANITAGHIIILSLVGLVFVFGKSGESLMGASVGAVVATIFAGFMNMIELLVAFLQAFIFSMLGASYIGAAVEEHDHHAAHDHH